MTSAPGGAPLPPALSAEQAAALAKAHGLEALGGRPPFGTYVRTLWRRRSFLWTLASADAAEKNSEDRLGVIWTLLNPLLLVVSYFLIFGLLLDTKRTNLSTLTLQPYESAQAIFSWEPPMDAEGDVLSVDFPAIGQGEIREPLALSLTTRAWISGWTQ